MRSIFDLDSPLMQGLAKLGDWMFLNVLFWVSCIPVITIGAAHTALFDVTRRIQNSEGTVWKSYWKAFLKDFKKSTLLWVVLLVTGIVIAFSLIYYGKTLTSVGEIGRVLCVLAVILWLLASVWIFPINARYDNTVFQTLKNSLMCGCMFIIKSVIAVLLTMLPIVLYILATHLFLKMIFVWALLWFSVSAAIIHALFQKTFDKLEKANVQDENNP